MVGCSGNEGRYAWGLVREFGAATGADARRFDLSNQDPGEAHEAHQDYQEQKNHRHTQAHKLESRRHHWVHYAL
jgi:hypothetical protein